MLKSQTCVPLRPDKYPVEVFRFVRAQAGIMGITAWSLVGWLGSFRMH